MAQAAVGSTACVERGMLETGHVDSAAARLLMRCMGARPEGQTRRGGGPDDGREGEREGGRAARSRLLSTGGVPKATPRGDAVCRVKPTAPQLTIFFFLHVWSAALGRYSLKNSLNQSEWPATMIVLSFRFAAQAAKSSMRCIPRKPRPLLPLLAVPS